MTTHLSIKNVPDELAQRLRERARRNHRSLQGELMAIIEAAVEHKDVLEADEVLDRVRRLGLSTAADAARTIRRDRNDR